MKVYAMDDERFRFVTDFRAQRGRKHLSEAPTHVDWSLLVDNFLATSLADGAVVLWSLEKERKKRVYHTHGHRAVRVRFHRGEPNLLLSAAKNSLLLYDFRVADPVKRFCKDSTDMVYEIQFGIHDAQKDFFVVSDEGGLLSFFDIRAGERSLRKFLTHRGTACVSFNPNYFDSSLVATGGQDKCIRVWNWTDWSKGSLNDPIFSLEAYSVINRVFWRPNYKFQVVSCSFGDDPNIYIWDVRRPFFPISVFSDHEKSYCAGAYLIWNSNIEDKFVSVSRDGVIVLHYVKNAEHPIDYISDICIDTSPNMDFTFAVSSQLKAKNEALEDEVRRQEGKPTAPRRRQFDPFQSSVKSHLIFSIPKELQNELSVHGFCYLAKKYKLSGSCTKSLCIDNSYTAQKLGYFHLAQTWRTIAVLATVSPFIEDKSQENTEIGTRARFLSARYAGKKGFRSIDHNALVSFFAGQPTTAALVDSSDFYFGDGEFNINGLCGKQFSFGTADFVGTLPPKSEAFYVPNSEESVAFNDTSLLDSFTKGFNRRRELTTGVAPLGELSVFVNRQSELFWNPIPMLQQILFYYAELGDVQTCVSILLVLGSRAARYIDSKLQILWFRDYLELLDRLELFVTSAEVIKRCWFPSISSLSLQSTFARVACSECKTISLRCSSCCMKCKQKFNFLCSVCTLPVRGVWGWCKRCHHGGHPNHLAEWFSSYDICAKGCGCKCSSFI
uniref:GATOR2 complex protein WDR24 n=1 Tax=Syphacia muris TaxID=451379 RepID=A0A0N5AMW9_9BILA